jgi:hypothetical protein
MTDQQDDPLAQFGLDAIDLRWTLKDIASCRTWLINKDHLPKLIELGLVEMREDVHCLTESGRAAAWKARLRRTVRPVARSRSKINLPAITGSFDEDPARVEQKKLGY